MLSDLYKQKARLMAQIETEENSLLKDVGENIRRHRKIIDLTQNELADMLNISRTQITNIELGTCGLTTVNLIGLCNALDVSSDELLGINTG